MTELTAIATLPAETARVVLAMALLEVLGETPKRESTVPENEAVDAVLAEARTLAGVTEDDAGGDEKVADVLGRTLAVLALPPDRVDDTRNRLGQRGRLPQSQYALRVGFAAAEFGFSAGAIANLAMTPDAVQHLVIDDADLPLEDQAITLLAKRIHPAHGEAYVALAHGQRQGGTIDLDSAWRVYPSLVPMAGGMTPLDILNRFLARYGLLFSLYGEQPSLLVVYKRIPVSGAIPVAVVKPPDVRGPAPEKVIYSMATRLRGNQVEVSLAYALDSDRYRADMRSRGLTSQLTFGKRAFQQSASGGVPFKSNLVTANQGGVPGMGRP